jgi:hypothetical protein
VKAGFLTGIHMNAKRQFKWKIGYDLQCVFFLFSNKILPFFFLENVSWYLLMQIIIL